MKRIAFFGHRRLWGTDIRDRIKRTIEENLEGETRCLIGVHGDYDKLSLSVCRQLRESYPSIKICVVFTTLTVLQKRGDKFYSKADEYSDVETIIYDIEEAYFKNKIILSNRKMVDDSDLIICYVDEKRHNSGAKRAVAYALKRGKKVINLFCDGDRN